MNTSRRSFLKAAGAAGLFNIVPAKTLWGATAPSNQLTRALIGFGAIAHSANHLPYKGSRLVGLCDPFECRVRNGLAAAESAIGSLDRITRVVKVVGFVASDPAFTGQPGVINGASEVLGEIFGDLGVHARSAVGVAVLPLDSPVEVELIVEFA